jgi:hypothetical protein
MGSSYEGTTGPVLPAGRIEVAPGDTSPYPHKDDKVWTFGVNFNVTRGVVVKADYQLFANNTDFNRLDLGLGLAF